MVIWLVGLSAAGQTTIGRRLFEMRKRQNAATVLVDGDEIRRIFKHDRHRSAYSVEGRRANAERIYELCAWLDGQGIDVVCCILCIFPDVLAENRRRFSDYFEVFVDVPLEVAERRDAKGVYQTPPRGESANVVGHDIPFPRPEGAALVLDNSREDGDSDVLAAEIEAALEARRA
jgi:adenylylsulfate kinase